MPKAESWEFNSVICPEIVSPVSPVTATLCSPDAVCTANVSVTPLAIATAAIEPTATGAVLSTPVPCSPRPVALTDWPVRFTFTVELAKELWPPPIYTPRLAAFTVLLSPRPTLSACLLISVNSPWYSVSSVWRLPVKVCEADSVASVCRRSSIWEMLLKPPSGECPFRVLVRVHEFLQTIGVLEIGLLDCIAAFRQHGLLEIEPSIRPLR